MPNRHAARRGWLAAAATRAALLASLAVATLATFGALDARADEAYVCEGGRVVTVRMGELEVLKRKDPCIAAYYGVKLEAETAASSSRGADAAEPPLPERKPAAIGAAAEVAAADTPAAMPAVADAASLPAASHAISPDIVTSPRVERVVFRHAQRASAEPVATGSQVVAAPVDFRRVPIINAAPGAPGIFYHTR
jgi:hypothetical protein